MKATRFLAVLAALIFTLAVAGSALACGIEEADYPKTETSEKSG